ncbi:MAG: hypothetical protein Q7J54_07520 [Candidatus Woesearchaeota archaeon]|nr:hypothetical protein [Candidatus Woesearchaeota archaeon]
MPKKVTTKEHRMLFVTIFATILVAQIADKIFDSFLRVWGSPDFNFISKIAGIVAYVLLVGIILFFTMLIALKLFGFKTNKYF